MNYTPFVMAALLGLAAVAINACASHRKANDNAIPTLQPKAFIERARADKRAVLMDVRTPDEYAAGHLKGARQLNYLDSAAFHQGVALLDKSHTYYIYCRSGKRSHAACLVMMRHGLRVVDMEGGYLNWTAQGMDVEK